MKVSFSYKCHGPEGRYRLRSYAPTAPPTMCCEEMAQWWDHLVCLGVRGLAMPHNVCCVLAYQLDFGPDTGAVQTVVPIDYCPWCAAPLEAVPEGFDPAPETQPVLTTVPELNF
jgi:hypothetical protein